MDNHHAIFVVQNQGALDLLPLPICPLCLDIHCMKTPVASPEIMQVDIPTPWIVHGLEKNSEQVNKNLESN